MNLEQLRSSADVNGLFVRRVLVPARWSRKAWYHAHDMGYLVSIHEGVSRHADTPVTPELLIAAAVATAQPRKGSERAMAAGRAAAYLVGVEVPWDDPIHVATRGRPPWAVREGVAIHRPTHHLDLVANEHATIPCTRLVRMLLDVAAWDPELTWSVLEQVLVKRLLTIEDVQAALQRHSRRGRPGLTVLRRAVDAWGLRQRPPDSVLEARFARLLKAHGLPGFEFQRPVGRHRPDFTRVRERIIAECDGFNDHGRRQLQVERDKARDAELAADGWVVLRFTWHQINRRDGWVAAQIRRTLARRSAQLGLGP